MRTVIAFLIKQMYALTMHYRYSLVSYSFVSVCYLTFHYLMFLSWLKSQVTSAALCSLTHNIIYTVFIMALYCVGLLKWCTTNAQEADNVINKTIDSKQCHQCAGWIYYQELLGPRLSAPLTVYTNIVCYLSICLFPNWLTYYLAIAMSFWYPSSQSSCLWFC